MNLEKIRPYYPALILLGLSLFFMAFPMVAALMVIAALLSLGALYAWVVFRFQQVRTQTYRTDEDPNTFETDYYDFEEPTFRNVSVHIQKRFRDI